MSAIETIPVAEPGASTGPTSEEGKAVSSRNAVKHNLCSKKLSGADLEEFNEVRAKLEEEWEPSSETERMLLEQMALSQWRMGRALEFELAVFDQESGFGRSTGDRCRCAEPESTFDASALALVLRYRTTAERAFYKALTELQRLRASMRQDACRQQDDEEAAVQREIERLIMAPIGPMSAQPSGGVVRGSNNDPVSQNPVVAVPALGLPQEAASFSDRPHFVSQNHPQASEQPHNRNMEG
jgi:hypothetical protein